MNEENERELKSQQQRNEYVCWMKKKKKQIEATDKPLLVYIPFRKSLRLDRVNPVRSSRISGMLRTIDTVSAICNR
jgi:hypothetical protein